MVSQFYNSSFFKSSSVSLCKPQYPWRLVSSVLQSISSKICMCLSSSAINAVPLNLDNDSLLHVYLQQPKVIPPKVAIYDDRIKQLKENTRRTLMSISDPITRMKLIDTIQRLGVGNHFDEEIHEILVNLTYNTLPDHMNLHTVALLFRLQRHNGLHTNAGTILPQRH